jgi:AcrR family transcriptional regulator
MDVKEKDRKTDGDAYQRILSTARDLFYRQGYRATGINEIIEKSGVAKATFYANFPSKDDLALAYVKAMNEKEAREVSVGLEKYSGPYEKLLGLLEWSIDWSKERDFRGCAYLNISSEVPDHEHPVRQESKGHYRTLRSLIGSLMKELKAKRGAAWKDRDPDKVADDYMLIFAGALAMSQIYHDAVPFREAVGAAKRLLA